MIVYTQHKRARARRRKPRWQGRGAICESWKRDFSLDMARQTNQGGPRHEMCRPMNIAFANITRASIAFATERGRVGASWRAY